MIEPADATGVASRGAPPPEEGLGIYVHWPFCLSKCPYCDFNSHVADAVDHDRWRAALTRDLASLAARTEGRAVTSIFFGGGTPSLMPPGTVARIIDAAAEHWSLPADVEITLECNPTTAETGRFAAYRTAGINRLSIGVQSFDDDALRFLGRTHSAAEAHTAVRSAQAVFARTSFDLIYGLPGQSAAAWRRQLRQAVARAGEHLSAYQLTVEPGTAFWRARVQPADDACCAELYEITQEVLADAGLAAYEISNHCGDGGACRHNLAIWRGGEYVGIGPGAHGRLRRAGATAALRQVRSPAAWLDAVEARGTGLAGSEPLTSEQRQTELVLLGLRLSEGICKERFLRLSGTALDDLIDAAAASRLIDAGLVHADARTMRVTPAGRLMLDTIIATVWR